MIRRTPYAYTRKRSNKMNRTGRRNKELKRQESLKRDQTNRLKRTNPIARSDSAVIISMLILGELFIYFGHDSATTRGLAGRIAVTNSELEWQVRKSPHRRSSLWLISAGRARRSSGPRNH